MAWNDKQSQATSVYVKLLTLTLTEFLLNRFIFTFFDKAPTCQLTPPCTKVLSSESVATFMYAESESCVQAICCSLRTKAW